MESNKPIESFREEEYGLFIDLGAPRGHIGVDRATGDILLDEGAGADRYHGAVIRAASFRGFTLSKVDGKHCKVRLEHGRNGNHELGLTGDFKSASRWIRLASRLIRSKQKEGAAGAASEQASRDSASKPPPPSSQQVVLSAPQLRTHVSIFSDAVYLVHPPVNYAQFHTRPEFEALLDWTKDARQSVCVLSGAGGSGKSTLATHVLLSLCPGSIAGTHPSESHFRSGFYYSFYSNPRPQDFLRSLARWMNPHSRKVPTSAITWLETLRQATECLLVVDGLEVLANELMHAEVGGLSLDRLFCALADRQAGSARWLLTSRGHESLVKSTKGSLVTLGPLPSATAISLLRSHGVDGRPEALLNLATALGNHPLTLDLAGNYIREFGWDASWTALFQVLSSKTERSSLASEMIGRHFMFRVAKESPGTGAFLARVLSNRASVHDRTIDVSNDWLSVDDANFSWGLELLKRSGMITTYTEHRGKVGLAEGGVANYQFEPTKDAAAKPRMKVFLPSNRIMSGNF